MLNHNYVALCGRLTAEPEKRETESGLLKVAFRVAVNGFPDKDGNPTVDFIPVIAWRKTAEFICGHFHKGSAIFVEGQLKQRTFEKDGVKRSVIEVVADRAKFVENKSDGAASEVTPSEDADIVGAPSDEDLPF